MNRNNPPEPHTNEWCLQNPKRCKDNISSVSIESNLLTTILIIAAFFLVLNALKLINMKTIYLAIQKALFGNKSCMPNELKGFK